MQDRHTLALAARDHDVLGVDISTEAIGHARRAADAAGLDEPFRVGDGRLLLTARRG